MGNKKYFLNIKLRFKKGGRNTIIELCNGQFGLLESVTVYDFKC